MQTAVTPTLAATPMYVSVKFIAAQYRLSKSTVRGWIDSGLLPTYTLPGGKRKKILVSDYADFVRNNPLPVRDS